MVASTGFAGWVTGLLKTSGSTKMNLGTQAGYWKSTRVSMGYPDVLLSVHVSLAAIVCAVL